MNNFDSLFINIINSIFRNIQDKLSFISENSFFIKYLDKFIFFLLVVLLILSTFATTNTLGIISFCIFILTLLKLMLVKDTKITIGPIGVIIFCFLIFTIISVFNSTLVGHSLKGFSKTLIYISFYFSTGLFFKDNKNKILTVLSIISILVAIESIYALMQGSWGIRQISTWQDVSNLNPEQVFTRVYGTLKPYNPNLLAAYSLLALIAPISLFFVNILNRNYKLVLIYSAISLITIITIIQTGCRGAYLGLFAIFISACFIIFKLIKSNRYKDYFKIGIGSIITIATFIIIITPALLKRVISIFTLRADSSTAFRLNVYNSSLKMFYDNFLFGIGTGNQTFREIYGLYMVSAFDALSSYNIFLEIGVESGIFALICFILIFFTLLYYGFRFILSNNRDNMIDKIIVSGSILVLIATIVHGFVDTVFFRPQVQFIFWLNIAILTTLVKSSEKRDNANTNQLQIN